MDINHTTSIRYRKCQMSMTRVECARMFLSDYGRRVRYNRKWGKIINTEFSAKPATLLTEIRRMILLGASQENLLVT